MMSGAATIAAIQASEIGFRQRDQPISAIKKSAT
jgi:hypothetical protein